VRRRRFEAAAETLAVVAVPITVFVAASDDVLGPSLVLAMVPVAWVASRRTLVAAYGGSLVLAVVAIVGARIRLGAVDHLAAVQFVVLAGALTTLVAAGAARSGRLDRAARASHEAHLRALSLRDPRTGLANRAGLLDELTRTGPHGRQLVVVELERFAAVAAALGDAVTDDLLHAAGDASVRDGRRPQRSWPASAAAGSRSW
jgi:hypothetical protein